MNTEQIVDATTTESSTESSLDDRADAIKAQLASEDPPVETIEGEPAKAKEPASDARTERQKRLEALRAGEAEKEAKREQYRAQRSRDEQLTKLQAERDALQAKAALAETFEKGLSTEEGFFELAQKANVSPEKLAAYIRDAIADPTKDVTRKAVAAVAPEVASLKEELAALKSQLNKAEEERSARESERAEHEARAVIIKEVATYETNAPHTARYLKALGEEAFFDLAENVGKHLPRGCGAQVLFDAIEEQLEQLSSVYQSSPNSQSTSTSKPAAAKAPNTTLSNRAASSRASVVEEPNMADLSLDERAARLTMLLGGLR